MRYRASAIIVWSLLWTAACGGGAGSSPTTPDSGGSPSGGGGSISTGFAWDFNGTNWQAVGTPTPCPSPFVLAMPVDPNIVTSILYPGQTRGGDYKPHGGFRFDGPGQTNDVEVRAPFSGMLFRGVRYTVNGEIQYSLDVIHPCGFMFRFGHMRELTSRFQTFANMLPAPLEGDSRTTVFPAGNNVAEGELIATAVGIRANTNVFLDWGVYDLRQRNASSADPAWFAAHPGDVAAYAVCWFDMLSSANSALVHSLPSADGAMGRTSDFCH
jgi:hypothetical protein